MANRKCDKCGNKDCSCNSKRKCKDCSARYCGPDLPCLGIRDGDCINKALRKINDIICEAMKEDEKGRGNEPL